MSWVLREGKTAVSAGSWVLKLWCRLESEFERKIKKEIQGQRSSNVTRPSRHEVAYFLATELSVAPTTSPLF